MGRRGGKWFGAVEKVFRTASSKDKNDQKKNRSKKKWGFGKCSNYDANSSAGASPNNLRPLDPPEEGTLAGAENDQSRHAYSAALASASAVAAEAAAVAAKAAAVVARLTKSARFSGRSKEEVAAIKIQTAFRGYLARRELRAFRGLVRLKSLTNSPAVKRQAAATLSCMQTLARVHAQIRSRRIRMSEENQALQMQLQLKHERELEKFRMAEEWNDGHKSKEQMEAHLQHKQEAAVRRERALAYAFSHQWKSSSRTATPTFMDPNNPQWGWSWMERWMAARPWENRNLADRESDRVSVKSTSCHVTGAEITKAYAYRDTIPSSKSSCPGSCHSPSTPPPKAPSITGKFRSASTRSGSGHTDNDSNSIVSIQSERPRRHSINGSLVRDDKSLGSTTSVPTYLDAVKGKSRHQGLSSNKTDASSKRSLASSVRKMLSFPAAAAPFPSTARRHSGPPKVDVAPLTSNGGRK